MSIFFTYNDNLYNEGTAVITPGNRSFKYGDGIFETVKVNNGTIQLSSYHFDRLFSAMASLHFQIPEYFTRQYLQERIIELCKKNDHTKFARVRLTVFRGNGGLYDPENHVPNYIIQSWDLAPARDLNSHGLTIDIYSGAVKSCDQFSNLKNNNFLPYAMAALHAQEIKVNDCILLNSHRRICDSTIANIFIIKEGIMYTPPLSEGCIAGVMRRCIIEKGSADHTIIEKPLSIDDLENADEVFLTNAIRGVTWVKQFRTRNYTNLLVKTIHATLKKSNHD